MRRLLPVLCALPCLAAAPQERDAQEVPVDRDLEVASAPGGALPVLGPRQALVTIDVLQPLGGPVSVGNLALVLRLARELRDLRLIYHPVPTTPTAERGEEALQEALLQERFWPLCERLHARPELLAPDREPALLDEAARLGVDARRLRAALTAHQHRARVQDLWRKDRDVTLSVPELWVNGKRLQGAVSEGVLRDEIERRRERAAALLREGAPLSQIYDRQVQEERERSLPWMRMRLARAAARPPVPGRVHIDSDGAPARGPKVAPVTLVFFGSLEGYSNAGYADLLRGAMERHPGRLRLLFLPLPTPGSSAAVTVAWHLGALGERAPADFWRAYDALVQEAKRRYQLSARDVRDVLQRARIDLSAVPPYPARGAALTRLEGIAGQAKRLGIEAPPALFVNGLLLRGSLTADSLEEALRRELDLGLIGRLREGEGG